VAVTSIIIGIAAHPAAQLELRYKANLEEMRILACSEGIMVLVFTRMGA